jgi:hypothetical protein
VATPLFDAALATVTPLVAATVDPLTAPLDVVLGETSPLRPSVTAAPYGAADPPINEVATEPATAPAWPCDSCGALNEMAADRCDSCGLPFGAALAGPRFDSSARKRRNLQAAGAVLAVLALLAGITWLSTKRPPATTQDAPVPAEAPSHPGGGRAPAQAPQAPQAPAAVPAG